MNHLGEEQLVLLYYGESQDAEGDRRHLGSCPPCSAAYARLEQTLAVVSTLPVPERTEDYGSQVWRRISSRLSEEPVLTRLWNSLAPPPAWMRAAVAALLLIAAFVTGRYWPRPEPAPPAAMAPPPVRERILMVAVGNHMERSQRVLVELIHVQPNGGADISSEQQQARRLVADGRLYRQAAARAGQAGTAQVLDELERVLVEIANSPTSLSAHDLEAIQQRIESQGILFKVRILATQAHRSGAARRPPIPPKEKS